MNFFPHDVVTYTSMLGLLTMFKVSIVNDSLPFNPRLSAVSPDLNCSGKMPIPTRLDLWILSYDSAMTALTPWR